MYAHFDPEADVAWFLLESNPETVGPLVSERTANGLVERNEEGHVVGVEVWQASRRLPVELLEYLPRLTQQDSPAREPVGR